MGFGSGKKEDNFFFFFEKVKNPIVIVQHVLDDSQYVFIGMRVNVLC